jgi:hypothetical protein
MLQMRLDRLVQQIVSHHLLGQGREKEALYLNFDLRMSSFSKSDTFDASRGLHLLYHLRPGYQSVSVFSAVTDSPFSGCAGMKWKHEVTHDSCWR